MVEQMEKVTLVFLSSVKDAVLRSLQQLGVVHIESRKTVPGPEMAERERIIEGLEECRNILGGNTGSDEEAPAPAAKTEGQLIAAVRHLDKKRSDLEKRKTETESEIKKISLWGDFDPLFVDALEERGLRFSVYSSPVKHAGEVRERLENDPAVTFIPLTEKKANMLFALVYPKESTLPHFQGTKLEVPRTAMGHLETELEEIIREKQNVEAELQTFVRYVPFIEQQLKQRQNELAFYAARQSGADAAEGRVTVLTGWVPAAKHSALTDYLDSLEIVYITESPGLDEQVPVKLKQGAFPKLFQPILRIFSLPDYHEVDPTPFFAPFYMIFFGLCVADFGYGMLLLAAAFAALIILKRKAAKQLIYLGMVLAVSVLVFGVFLNDFFGIKLTEISKPDSAFRQIILFKDPNSAMLLAVMLGVIQVMFGYVLKVINRVRVHGVMGAMKPAGVILMLFGIVILVLHSLGKDFHIGPIPLGAAAALIPAANTVGYICAGAGLALIIFLGSVEHKPLLRPLFGIWELYEIATGIPGDILSYLRLYALGLSGGLLAEAILHIAVLAKGNSPAGIIPMALILLVGTGLNLAIGLLSAFVHSLRLTFVEFYKAVGFKGGGIEYTPFKMR